jgi:hypothetical protein
VKEASSIALFAVICFFYFGLLMLTMWTRLQVSCKWPPSLFSHRQQQRVKLQEALLSSSDPLEQDIFQPAHGSGGRRSVYGRVGASQDLIAKDGDYDQLASKSRVPNVMTTLDSYI